MKRFVRGVRTVFCVMGVLFTILLGISAMQYIDRQDAGDTACGFTHCT